MVTDPVRDNDNNNNMALLKWRDKLRWHNSKETRRVEMEEMKTKINRGETFYEIQPHCISQELQELLRSKNSSYSFKYTSQISGRGNKGGGEAGMEAGGAKEARWSGRKRTCKKRGRM